MDEQLIEEEKFELKEKKSWFLEKERKEEEMGWNLFLARFI